MTVIDRGDNVELELFTEDDEGFDDAGAYAFLAGLAEPLTAAFWNSADHPRDNDGKFREVTGADVTLFAKRFADAKSGPDEIRQATTFKIFQGRPQGPGGADATSVAAVEDYMSPRYRDINGGLQDAGGNLKKVKGREGGGPATSTETIQGVIRDLDNAMKQSTVSSDVRVVRGVNGGKVFGSNWRPDGDMTGLTWTDHRFGSTSAQLEYAATYLHDERGNEKPNMTLMNILVPAGTHAIFAETYAGDPEAGGKSAKKLSELILNRGQTYRIVRDRGLIDGIRVLDIEVMA